MEFVRFTRKSRRRSRRQECPLCATNGHQQFDRDSLEKVLTNESGCSTEREGVGMNPRIQELNCERAIPYHTVLSD